MSKYKGLSRGEHEVDGVRLLVIDDFSAVSLGPVGDKVVSASEPPAEPSEPETATDALVNINTASEGELETLEGIGQAAARRIVNGRPFDTVDDLVRVRGVSDRTVDINREQITA